jgi:hypothetical protein
MRGRTCHLCSLFLVILSASECALTQAGQENRTLVINGQKGEAAILQVNGRSYIDLETLARIANGSVGFQGNQIVLTLPVHAMSSPATAPAAGQPIHTGFSRDFMAAGIEEMAVIREWRSAIAYAIQNGYPIAGDWVASYRGRAAESLRLASIAASTDSDQNALQLLTNEFETVRKWSGNLVEARRSMDASKYMSPDALENDVQFQKILSCAHFLTPVLASGKFQDDPSCH